MSTGDWIAVCTKCGREYFYGHVCEIMRRYAVGSYEVWNSPNTFWNNPLKKERDEARAWARKLYRQVEGQSARIGQLEVSVETQSAYIAQLEAAVRDAEYFAHKDADARKLRDELRARGK